MRNPSSYLTRWLYRLSPVRFSRPSPTPLTSRPSSSEVPPPLTINDAVGDFVCPFLMPQCEELIMPPSTIEDPDAPLTNLYPSSYR